MRLLISSILCALPLLPPASLAADGGPTGSIPGKAQLQLRLRSEQVDERGLPRDANATTLRTRLTWTSPAWRAWQATLEVDDIRAVDVDAYNSTVNGQALRPVVSDPPDTELNRAVLEWKRPAYDLALGRQRLVLDNQRFVGNVGWRQNEQTFDGATLHWRPAKKTELTLAWFGNVNRVYGPRSGTQAANWHGDVVVAHARADLGKAGVLAAFWHGLDFANAAGNSLATAGLHWSGSADLGGGWRLPWVASLATQRDHGDNPADYSAPYRLLELGLGHGPATLHLGVETLGGDATRANARFLTPLATLHAFQGWADKFLVTPPQGIEDRYVSVDALWHGTSGTIAWHDYRADAVDRRYGHEWNVSVAHKFGKRYELLGKWADYSSDGFATDTRKAWLMVTATF